MEPKVNGIKTQDETYKASGNNGSNTRIGNALGNGNVGNGADATAATNSDNGTLNDVQAKNAEKLRKKDIAEYAKKLGLNEKDLLAWIEKYLKLSETQLYQMSKDEYDNGFLKIINEAYGILLENSKQGKLTKDAAGLLKTFGEQCKEYLETGMSIIDIGEYLKADNSNVRIRAKNYSKGKRGRNLKKCTFLELLKQQDKSLEKYNDLKDIPKDKLVASVKKLISKSLKKILECKNDKDKIRAQITAFQGMLADMPNDQYVILMEAIKDIFDIKSLRAAVNLALNKANNPEDCENGNLDLLIQYIEQMGKEFGLTDDEILSLLAQFRDVNISVEKAKTMMNIRNSFETPEERETFDQIQLKIKKFYDKNPEKAKDPNYVITAEDLGLKSEREIKVFEKIRKALHDIAMINAGIISNVRCGTTEEDIHNAQNGISQGLQDFGFDLRDFDTHLREVIKDITQNNPEFFKGKSIKDIYDSINKYTKGKFGENTGCYGNKTAESFSSFSDNCSEATPSYSGLGFETRTAPSNETYEMLQDYRIQNETENNNTFEYVGTYNDNASTSRVLDSLSEYDLVSNEAYFDEAWSKHLIDINSIVKGWKNACQKAGAKVWAYLDVKKLDRANILNSWNNISLSSEAAGKYDMTPEEIAKLKLDTSTRNNLTHQYETIHKNEETNKHELA